jgi:hypothetical protein
LGRFDPFAAALGNSRSLAQLLPNAGWALRGGAQLRTWADKSNERSIDPRARCPFSTVEPAFST